MMDVYRGEWDLKKIALFLIIVIFTAFLIYNLLLHPDDTGFPIEPAVNECSPFPAKIGGYMCQGINDRSIAESSVTACMEYDDGGECIKQSFFRVTEIYAIDYSNPRADANLKYDSITLEETDGLERYLEAHLTRLSDTCSNITELMSRIPEPEEKIGQCQEVSTDDARGFFIESRRQESRARRLFLLVEGNTLINVANDGRSGDDLLSFSELKQLISDFREYRTKNTQK